VQMAGNVVSVQSVVPPPVRPLRVGLLASLNELDPRKAVDYVSGMILDQIFEPPYAAVGERTEPRLFEPLRNEDAGKSMQYSAAIRPGITFSDGTPLTAEIAARSLSSVSVFGGKAKVDVHGDRVWFILASPNPRFELTLTQSSCAIVLDRGAQLHGTGPYMFSERPNLRMLQRATQLRLVRNPHYSGTVRSAGLEFHVLPSEGDGTPRALVEALRGGTIDLTTALSAADLTAWKVAGVAPLTRPSNSTCLLFMNTERRPFDSAPARRAVAAAIDLVDIASRSYDRNPIAFVATNVLPPSMTRTVGTLRPRSSDAAQLARDSALQGARLTLLVPWCPRPYLLKPLAVAECIQKQLAAIGVTVSLHVTRNSDEYFENLEGGRFDLALGGWIADTADPADYYEALLSSHAIQNESLANHARWNDPTTDGLLERFRTNASELQRQQIERVIADEVPFLPLMYGQTCVSHGRQVRNVAISPTGSIALAMMSVA
jgi:ABC-type transport system substrate-binding protein